MATALVDSVVHWKKKLDRIQDEDTILNVIHKLSKIPITKEILESSHIGKTIRKLSKRDDIVGKQALAVLKKWRGIFANSKESHENSKSHTSNVSKKENIHKSKSSDNEKISYQNEPSHNKYKHNKYETSSLSSNSLQNNLSAKVDSGLFNTSSRSNAIYTYEKKETEAKYADYDPHADASEGYNPEFPEFFPGQKSKKRKLSDDDDDIKLLQKHKIKSEDQNGNSTKKKFKHHTNVGLAYDESKMSQVKKEKHSSHKDPKSHSSSVKKESTSNKMKADSDKTHSKKHKVASDAKKLSNQASGKSSKSKLKLNCSEEFTSTEASFEDCLGFNDIVTIKKKKVPKSQPPTKKDTPLVSNKKKATASSSPASEAKKNLKDSPVAVSTKEKTQLNVPKPTSKLSVVDIVSTLPETQPNYSPLPQRNLDYFSPRKRETLTNEDAIKFTSSRREKTAVYSGRRNFFAEVPSLFECCTRILIENIDAIEYLGQIPYFLIKPVLDKCTPYQLFDIERYNPDLLDSTNELWEVHCKKDYKLLKPQESETWRDLYLRAHDEREKKLKSVTANISASMSKSNPVRQVKLAYVDSFAKPPRDVARRQAKNGTARSANSTAIKAGPSKPSIVISKPAAAATSSGVSSSSFAPPKKPKVAPLMAKTLKSMRQCFRR